MGKKRIIIYPDVPVKLELKKYDVIYIDPPWNETGGGKIRRGADRHYPLMKSSEIKALKVNKLAKENCHLYMWTTNNFIKDAFEIIDAWGFDYKTMITWVKKGKIGLGQYFRGLTEHCLFAVKGQGYAIKQGQGRTMIHAPRGAHSEKPEKMRAMIEKVSSGDKVEIFARIKKEGWDVLGNDVDGQDIREILK